LVETYRNLPSSGLAAGLAGRGPCPVAAGKVAYRKCPICGDLMQRKNFGKRSGVIVDWCGEHGVWLDADELESIATFISRGGLKCVDSDFCRPYSAEDRDGQGDGDGGRPRNAEQVVALLTAEHVMARARHRKVSQALRFLAGHPGASVKKTLVDLLNSLWGN